MKNKGKSVVGLLLLLVLCLSLCAVSVVGADNTVAQADGETEISLSGIQMRGAINGWYYYLVLQSDGYNDLSSVESIADGTTILTSDKIKLYTSAEDSGTTLTDLTVQHVDQSFSGWTSGLFVNFAKYDSTHGGHQVYKVVVEKGCKLPYVKDGVVGTYVVDAEYTFVNQNYGDESVKLGAFNWTKTITPAETKETISLDGVQLRGLADLPDNSWYHYFVVTSAAFSGMAANEDNVEITTFATTLDKIKLYTVDSNGQLATKTLAELGVNHTERNKWGANGLFFAFDMFKNGYDGSTVYKVTIEKDCTLVADKGTVIKKFVVDKDYTFYNSSYGNADNKFGALTWTTTPTIPYGTEETEIALDGVQLRGLDGELATNPWYHYLVLLSSAYDQLGADIEELAQGLVWSKLDGVKLYIVDGNGALVGKTFAELNANHVGLNKWGTKGAFIGFGDYVNGYDGTNVFKIEIAKGTKLLAEIGETAKVFVVDGDYVFCNIQCGADSARYGAYKWLDYVPETETIAIDGVQMRGMDGADYSWYRYLVLLSANYAKYGFAENGADTIDQFYADKIKLYLNATDSGKTLAELGAKHIDQTFQNWSVGAYINFDNYADYNGSTVYKVTIESGCRIPVSKDGKWVWLYVDKDYTFYNVGYGDSAKAYGSFEWWTTPVPDSVENSGDIKVVNVTNQSDGVTRWLILWFNDKFVGTTNATFFETKQFVNVLDNVLIYSGNDLSQTPVTLRSIFDGTITIGQFGSPDAIGFTIKNDVKFDGSNMYIVVVKNGCEMPYVKDGVYSKRTVTADTTFINDNFGKSGEIPGSTGADKRTYEDWCIEWTPAVFVTYKVVGVDKTLDKVCLPIGEIISADKFAVDGYDVTITDNIGYTYYGQIVLPSVDVEITLTYAQKTPEPTPEPDANKGCNGVVATSSVVVSMAIAAIAVAFVAKKKKSC